MKFSKVSPWRRMDLMSVRTMPRGPDRAKLIEATRKRAGSVGGTWSALARAKKSGDKEKIIRAAGRCTMFCQSEERLERMLAAVCDQPGEIFWPVWLDHWCMVDHSAEYHRMLPELFKRKGSAIPYMDEKAKARFDALPEVVTVYRGCDREFVNGMSWSTNKKAAEYFATGGRYGCPDDPVVVIAAIEKMSRNFFYCSDDGGDQGEAEIVCSPETIITEEDYTGPLPGDPSYTTPWSGNSSTIL